MYPEGVDYERLKVTDGEDSNGEDSDGKQETVDEVHGKDSTFALDQDGENVTETETLCITAGQTSTHEDLLYCKDGVVEEGTVEAAGAALRRLQGDTYARFAGLVMPMCYFTYLEKERFQENVATIISETRQALSDMRRKFGGYDWGFTVVDINMDHFEEWLKAMVLYMSYLGMRTLRHSD